MPSVMPDPWTIYASALETFRARLSSFLGVQLMVYFGGIGAYIGIAAVTLAGFFLFRGYPIVGQVLQNLTGGVFGIVFLWLNAGLVRFHLTAHRGGTPAFEGIVKEHRLVPSYFLLNAAVTVVGLLVYLPGASAIGGLVYALHRAGAAPPIFIVTGVVLGLVYVFALLPLFAAMTVSAFFLIDRELDPIAAVLASLRAIRPHVAWCYHFGLVTILVYLALGVVGVVVGALTCGYGMLLLISYLILVQCEVYEQLSKRLAAQLRGDEPSEGEPASAGIGSEVEADPEGAGDLKGDLGEERPALDPKANPYAPPAAAVEVVLAAEGRELAAAPPAGCVELTGPPLPPGVLGGALVFLIPWVIAGGNPFSGGVIGFQLSRQLGIPTWVGGLGGAGGLLACGLAAFVVLLVGYRGRRRVVVDLDGFALDRTPYWTGTRLSWRDVASFRTTGLGVELKPRGLFGLFWRPIAPTQERETHDLVTRLEEAGIPRT